MATLFGHAKPNARGAQRLKTIEDYFEAAWKIVEAAGTGSSGGRELALAKTNLQQACTWAKKAVCESRENVEEETAPNENGNS